MGVEQTINLKVQVDGTQGMQVADKLNKAMKDAVNPTMRPASQTAAVKSANKATGQGETKTARSVGASAGTGSAASDFAAQAQGLGGLVHLYATFAANIFAVSAAFNALSKAMDTSNLVSGLDQLGAVSGRNLGTLAKQMVKAADGALSLRDALTSTALASSAGMTNANILRMTEVAKKASLALGRDMSDSMDRLTKGIAKTQPELLDELGIMTRMIPAQQEYARQLGKSASSLTEFEKRQAFANAVLLEGERKFGAIELNSNPYSKIAASVANLLQTGLELVNKVLSPLVSLLSQSPAGLAAVLAGIATVLVKQAIPAIGMFRENAKRMEEETHARVTRQVREQQAAAIASDAIVASKATRDYQSAKTTQEAIAKLQGSPFNKKLVGKDTSALLRKSPYDITDSEMAAIKAKHDELAANVDAKYSAQAPKIKKIYDGNLAFQKAALDAGYDATVVVIDKEQKAWTHASMKEAELGKLRAKARVSSILSSVADSAAVQGPTRAWALLNEEIAKSKAGLATLDDGTPLAKTTALSNGITRLKGGFSILTSAVGTAMNALSLWGQVIGVIVAGIAILDSWLTTTKLEFEAATKAVDDLKDSLENADRVLDSLSKKSPLERFNIGSLGAVATASQSLADDVVKTVITTKAYIAKLGFWDSISEGWKLAFGVGMQDKAAKEMSSAVSKILKLATPGKDLDKFKEKIAAALKIDPNDSKALDKAITFENLFKVAPKVTAAINEITAASLKTAQAGKELDSSFEMAGRTYDNIIASLSPTDNIAKLGLETIKLGSDLSLALEDPKVALAELVSISNNVSKLKLLPPDLATSLVAMSPTIKDTVSNIDALTLRLKSLEEEQSAVKAEQDKFLKMGGKDNSIMGSALSNRLTEISNTIANTITGIKFSNKAIDPLLNSLKESVPNVFARGGELVAMSIGLEFAKASITIQKAYAAGLSGTAGGTAETARVDKASIALQMQVLQVNMSMSDNLEKIRIATEESAIADARKTATSKEDIAKLDTRQQANEIARLYAGSKNSLVIVQELLKSKNAATVIAGQGMLSNATQKQGGQAQLAQLGSQSKAVDIGVDLASIAKRNELAKILLNTKTSELQLAKTLIDYEEKSSLYTTQELAAKKNSNIEALAANEIEKQKVDYKTKLEQANYTLSNATSKEAKANALASIKEINDTQAQTDKQNNSAKISRELAAHNVIIAALKSEQEFKLYNDKLVSEGLAKETAATQALQDMRIQDMTNLGIATAAEITAATSVLSIEKEKEASRVTQLQLLNDNTKTQFELSLKLMELEKTDPNLTGEAAQAIITRMALVSQLYATSLQGENSLSVAKQNTLRIEGASKILLDQQNESMLKMQDITTNLATIFGDLGNSIGKAGEALLKMAHDDEKYVADKKQAMLDYAASVGTDKEAEAVKNLTTLETKKAKSDIDNIGKVAGASKKMFGEKTAAYKLLDTVEKVYSVAKVAMLAKELALELGLITAKVTSASTTVALAPGEIAAEASKAPVKGTNAILSALSAPFPINFIAGAAMAAIVASLIGSVGGGADYTIPGGITAADRQKTQGTGQSYDANGNLVSNGGGVFGDTSAKSQSIQNSLDLIAATTVEGMSYSNETVRLLTSINDNIGLAAQSLYQVQGISTGSGFGTVEGTSGGAGGGILSGLFGSSSTDTSILDSGIQLRGTFMDLVNAGSSAAAVLNSYETTQTTTTRSGALFGLFGGGTSTAITDSVKELDQSVRESIGGVFSNAARLFIAQGHALGMTEQAVVDSLSNVQVDKLASLRGLKGAELQTELNAVISGILDDAARALFPQLDQFKKFGEGYSQTVTRVLDTNNKIGLAFKQLGMSMLEFPKTTAIATQAMKDAVTAAERELEAKKAKVANFAPVSTPGGIDGAAPTLSTIDPKLVQDVTAAEKALAAARQTVLDVTKANSVNDLAFTESLANAAGGVDKFLELTASFTDKYLSEAERFGPQRAALTEELTKMGLSTNLTKDGLKDLVLNYQFVRDATGKVTDASAQGYVDLLKLAEGLDTMAASAAAMADTFGIGASTFSQIIDDARQAVVDGTGAGYSIADALLFSVESAMYDEALNRIGMVMLDTVITPMITSILAGSFAADVASGAFDQMLADAIAMSATISAAFSDPAFLAALDIIMKKIGEGLSHLVDIIPSRPRDMNAERAKEAAAAKAAAEKAAQEAQSAIDKAKSALLAEYNKQVSALNATISAIRNSIKALKDYKNALLIGPASNLAPSQKYAETKARFDELTRLASMNAVTDAEKAAKADALAKLPEASDAFLAASKAMFASGEQYNRDFQKVLDVIDATTALLETQLSDTEKQLQVLQSNTTILSLISENTKSMEQLLKEYLDAVAKGGTGGGLPGSGPGRAEAIRDFINNLPKDAGHIQESVKIAFDAANSNKVSQQEIADAMGTSLLEVQKYFAQYGYAASSFYGGPSAVSTASADKLASIKSYIDDKLANTPESDMPAAVKAAYEYAKQQSVNQADIAKAMGMQILDVQKFFAKYDIPAFSAGGLAKGVSLVGENGPEIVDFVNPGRVYSNQASNDIFNTKELVAEIRNLRKEVADLRKEQQQQTNQLIVGNYDANNKAATKIADATLEATEAEAWRNRASVKIA